MFSLTEGQTKNTSLFKALLHCKDERFVKAFFVYYAERNTTFLYGNKTPYTLVQIREKGLSGFEKEARTELATAAQAFLLDIQHYQALQRNIETKSQELLPVE